MKKERLEEASWKHNPLKKLDGEFLRHAFKEGAKWQQERSYSEEEVYQLLCAFNYDLQIVEVKDVTEWFEQFKKK